MKTRFAHFQQKHHDSGHALCMSLLLVALLCRAVSLILYTVEFSKLDSMRKTGKTALYVVSAGSLCLLATLLLVGSHSANKRVRVLLTVLLLTAVGCEVFLGVDAARNASLSKAGSGQLGNAVVASESTHRILLAADVLSLCGACLAVLYLVCFLLFELNH